jgi:ATP-dependent Clp protease ATP-binding subunit ClpC
MHQRFTQQAIQTIMLAQHEARRTDRAFVGTEQILIGLIDEASSVAAQVLSLRGIDRARVVMETERIIGARGPGTYPLDLEIPFFSRL